MGQLYDIAILLGYNVDSRSAFFLEPWIIDVLFLFLGPCFENLE